MTRKKILLVDDSTTSLFVQQMILRRGPYRLVTAADGEEGVKKALAESPDLILMDVNMPRMGGIEAVRAIREHPATRHIPVILVTTPGEASLRPGTRGAWNDQVAKPVDADELLAKVRHHLGG